MSKWPQFFKKIIKNEFLFFSVLNVELESLLTINYVQVCLVNEVDEVEGKVTAHGFRSSNWRSIDFMHKKDEIFVITFMDTATMLLFLEATLSNQ